MMIPAGVIEAALQYHAARAGNFPASAARTVRLAGAGSMVRFLLSCALTATLLAGGMQGRAEGLFPAAVSSQRQALAFEDPALLATRQVIDTLLHELEPGQQLDWSVRLRPSVLYREYLDGRPDVLVSPRAGVIIYLRYGEKPVAAVRQQLRLERAFAAHERAARLGIRSALLAHAELLLHQDAAENARLALDALPQPGDPADAAASLRLAAGELALQQAVHALALARTGAREHGLMAAADYEPLRFVLPDYATVAAEDTPAWRILQLQVAEAEALLLQATSIDPLADLRIGIGYRNQQVELDLEGGMLGTRPGLRFAATAPGGRERFEVRMSTEILVDQKIGELRDLEQDLANAQAALARFGQDFATELSTARQEALFAAEALRLTEAELALAATPRAVSQSRTRVWRAWITYVRRVADLLEVTGGDWQLQ
jgi:hypothetical protein